MIPIRTGRFKEETAGSVLGSEAVELELEFTMRKQGGGKCRNGSGGGGVKGKGEGFYFATVMQNKNVLACGLNLRPAIAASGLA